MKETILILGISVLNLACFYIGALIGQKVIKNETLNPKIKSLKETLDDHKAQKEYQTQVDKYKIIESNIDAYDGTPANQQKIE